MLKKLSVAEQVASHLRGELARQRWTGTMPGRDKLARELAVHGSTIERALQLLEEEGLVKKSRPGKPRSIVTSARTAGPATTVGVLLYDAEDRADDYILSLRYQLSAAGYTLAFAPRSMRELKFDPDRIEAMAKNESVDAWIVYAGSRRILERFVQLSIPAFALFGRMSGLPIAGSGTDIQAALRETVHCLHGQGHRRIVMLTRTQLVESGLGLTERTFIRELEEEQPASHAPTTSPSWDNTSSGLTHCLDKLFRGDSADGDSRRRLDDLTMPSNSICFTRAASIIARYAASPWTIIRVSPGISPKHSIFTGIHLPWCRLASHG
jgi:DNA-binding transcriptional ArsR family regulator